MINLEGLVGVDGKVVLETHHIICLAPNEPLFKVS